MHNNRLPMVFSRGLRGLVTIRNMAVGFACLAMAGVSPAQQPYSSNRLPGFSQLSAPTPAVARFTRTLGTMVASGVPILDGLDIV
ncbi:MAG: hypothetical protein JKY61_11295, partial [Planctomycetes bacterium]|nr:hypothetical protein [Planctomycetota bacterium]